MPLGHHFGKQSIQLIADPVCQEYRNMRPYIWEVWPSCMIHFIPTSVRMTYAIIPHSDINRMDDRQHRDLSSNSPRHISTWFAFSQTEAAIQRRRNEIFLHRNGVKWQTVHIALVTTSWTFLLCHDAGLNSFCSHIWAGRWLLLAEPCLFVTESSPIGKPWQ